MQTKSEISLKHNHTLSKKSLNKLYVFFIDIKNNCRRNFQQFLNEEPNYVESWMQAYNEALRSEDDALTFEFISKIQNIAISHYCEMDQSEKLKELTTKGNKFGLRGMFKTDELTGGNIPFLNYNTTIEGLQALMDYWEKEQKYPTHRLIISRISDEFFIRPMQEDGITKLYYCTLQSSTIVREEIYNKVKHLNRIVEALEDPNYKLRIHSDPQFLEQQLSAESIDFTVALKQNIQSAIDYYEKTIPSAKTLKQKIKAIVQLCQTIDQNHIWNDGNVRTAYILMNYLLLRNKLPLSILSNANQLDCLSKEQLEYDVIAGQDRFLKLFRGKLEAYQVKEEEECMYGKQSMGLEDVDISQYVDKKTLETFMHELSKNVNQIDSSYYIDKAFYKLLDTLAHEKKLTPEMINKLSALYESREMDVLFQEASVQKGCDALLTFLFEHQGKLNINSLRKNAEDKRAEDLSKGNVNKPAMDLLTADTEENAQLQSIPLYGLFGKPEQSTEAVDNKETQCFI